jgi:hypothetical protein
MDRVMKLRIDVDFNSRTDDGKIIINLLGDPKDVKLITEKLADGMTVVLYDEGLEVEARLEFDKRMGYWLGAPDWKTKHYLS